MNVTLLMLAGGQGTRFGLLNAILPKSAIPVYDESTLARNVRQARAAGFREIIVSTRASFLKPVCELLAGPNPAGPGASIRVVANRYHRYGALPALLHLLNNLGAPRVALSLSDIFFMENAYRSLYEHSQLDDDYLAVADPFDPLELSKGGIVVCDAEQRIHSILETPIEGNAEGVRWSGLTVFNCHLVRHLKGFIAGGESDSPIGNFFEYYRAKGNELRAFRVSDFINVNTPDDMFLASMYRAMELQNANDTLGRGLSEVTSSVRKRLLRGKDECPDPYADRVEFLGSNV
jgi:NDP-sugar pyrophosphorylase family protein